MLISPHLSINHVGDHHDLVSRCIRELEGQFSCLDVVGEHNAVWPHEDVAAVRDDGRTRTAAAHAVPPPHRQTQVYGHPHVVRYVVLSVDGPVVMILSTFY